MRILITGSNGFIGGRVARSAARRRWEVVGLGRASTSATPVTRYLRHDLSRPFTGLPEALRGGVDAVVHCAALASPWAHPADYIAANVTGTRTVIDLCHRLADVPGAGGLPHLVFVSSSSVLYRREHQLGLTEDSPIPADAEQVNGYSRSKRIGERLTESYPGRWTVARPRAVFGPGDQVLLPRIVATARRGLLPVLQPAGGPPVLGDVTYVDTVAEYLLGAVSSGTCGTYNLTNGQPVEIYPFLLDVLARLGLRPRLTRVPMPVVMAATGLAETVSALALNYREPALTRFGATVLGYSKTFDVTRCRRDLGPPAVPLAEGVDRLVQAMTGAAA